MNDSPAGLAAWIAEKFHSWTDPSVPAERRITNDELLTNIMIYWVTGTIGSSIRSYFDNPPPREWVERRLNLKQWTEMPRGGHFAAMEEPVLLAEDMWKFFRKQFKL